MFCGSWVALPDQDGMPEPLSDRELDVRRLLDGDLTGPQIARKLYVSLNTLRTHTKRIFTKLDVNTRAAVVRRAHDRGPPVDQATGHPPRARGHSIW